MGLDPSRITQQIFAVLQGAHDYLSLLLLRLILAVEFGASGWEKYAGTNWFADIKDQFPFPFNIVPPDVSWFLATWFELIGAAALLLGLGTRFFSFQLAILTVVAIAAVHWPMDWHSLADLAKGYVITDGGFGNYKLPLIYLVMLMPLILAGSGKAGFDHLIRQRWLASRKI